MRESGGRIGRTNLESSCHVPVWLAPALLAALLLTLLCAWGNTYL